LRWQIELLFKRLKSLLHLDRLPAKDADLARAWLHAHLLIALLVEDCIADEGAFPP
jgi:IS4 transposase